MIPSLALKNCGVFYVGKNWSTSTHCIYLFSYLFKLCQKLEKQNSQTPKSHCFCYFTSSVGQKQKIWQSLPEAFRIQSQNTVGLSVLWSGQRKSLHAFALFHVSERGRRRTWVKLPANPGFLQHTSVQEALRAHMNKYEKLLVGEGNKGDLIPVSTALWITQ